MDINDGIDIMMSIYIINRLIFMYNVFTVCSFRRCALMCVCVYISSHAADVGFHK